MANSRGEWHTIYMVVPKRSLSQEQRAALEKIGVTLAYLHGSVSKDIARDDSDVDVAVLFESAQKDTVRATADVVAALQGLEASREMDVAILNTASPLFAQNVAVHGELLYARGERDVMSFYLRAMHEYEFSRRIAEIGRSSVFARAHL